MQIEISETKLWEALTNTRFYTQAETILDTLAMCGIFVKLPTNPARGRGFTCEYVPKKGQVAVRLDQKSLRMYFEVRGDLLEKTFKYYSMYVPNPTVA